MVCPVKMCNDGSGKTISQRGDLCIGCGECIYACPHGARIGIDDFDVFLEDVKKESIITVVDQSVVSIFGENYLKLNSFLKSLGVQAVFDESFGVELAAKSYADYMSTVPSDTIIAQTCSSMVSYIEIYRPELIPYLAPIDSSTGHIIKMIRRYYPQYADCKLAVISPCYSIKRELDETGYGNYNVTFKSLLQYFSKHGIDVTDFPTAAYDGPSAQDAAFFPSHERFLPIISRYNADVSNSRELEGEIVYKYFARFSESVEKGWAPSFVNCQNCMMGCNGGPGSGNRRKQLDEIEYPVEKLRIELLKRRKNSEVENREEINSVLSRYWEKGLYTRTYIDRSGVFKKRVVFPSQEQINKTLVMMHKTEPRHFLNCGACGYRSCEQMAVAIINGLNRPENCRYFVEVETLQQSFKALQIERDELAAMKDNLKVGIFLMDKNYIIQEHYSRALENVLAATELQGRKFTELLEDTLSEREIKAITLYFYHIINHTLNQKMMSNMNILKEIKYQSVEQPVKKTLSCDFAPVQRANDEVFILATIEDITTETNLKKKLRAEERKRQEELSAFFEVLPLAQNVFADFIESAEYYFYQIMVILKDESISSEEAVQSIYEMIHSLKLDALALGLHEFGANLDDMEDLLKQVQSSKGISFMDTLDIALEFENILKTRDKLVNNVETVFVHKSNDKINHDEYVLVEFLRRTCSNAVTEYSKKAQFEDVFIDVDALQYAPRRILKESLVQLVINAVAHGIESPRERLAKGKPESGVIKLSIKQTPEHIRVCLSDDGNGIDFDKVRRTAIKKQIINVRTHDKQTIIQAMFHRGFSSGDEDFNRDGNGLNRVYNKIHALGGLITIQSQESKGTVFIIDIPKGEV
jgi:iron only hydrogenase large subunit-like protein/signal transduction histidine kinase